MARLKGPRLYLRHYKNRPATWIIIDGTRHVYLGLPEEARTLAEHELREHLRLYHGGRPDDLAPEIAALLPRRRPGFVYFATCDRPVFPIKIGFAVNVPMRMVDLQVALPWPLVLLGSNPGTPDTELEIHQRFARLRLNGEWFARGDELLEFIKGVAATTSLVWRGSKLERNTKTLAKRPMRHSILK
jgi:hypothetical protein